MREIKFRAWESNQNKMDYNPYGDEMICEGTPINLLFKSPMDGQVLMQYTGLKDKNGVEIYEGDIVRADILCDRQKCDCPPGEVEFPNVIGIIESDPMSLLLNIGKNGRNCWYTFESTAYSSREIIGNIYENPELVK